MDCSLPGSSVYGILQARIVEWVAMPSSRGSSPPRGRTCVSCISCTAGGFFTTSATWEATLYNTGTEKSQSLVEDAYTWRYTPNAWANLFLTFKVKCKSEYWNDREEGVALRSVTRKKGENQAVYWSNGGKSNLDRASQVALVVKNLKCGFDLWVPKIPWRRESQPTPVFLPGESHGLRSLAGYSPWGCKEADMT